MILSDLVLAGRANCIWTESGMDSVDKCFDKVHFDNFPYPVSYNYNSRGFRDAEWPDSRQDLQDAIWCIGDSFTVGLGSPIEHTWPVIVSQRFAKRTINVSMDGASNEWISRQVINICKEINPTHMIIMWSHFNRRENTDSTLTMEQRRIHATASTDHDDIENFLDCVTRSNIYLKNCIHFTIPAASPWDNACRWWDNIKGPDWPNMMPSTLNEFNQLPKFLLTELKTTYAKTYQLLLNNIQALALHRDYNSRLVALKNYYGSVPILDLARDGHHFDLLTSQWVAAEAMKIWNHPH